MKYLPSKSFLAIIALIIVAGGIFGVYRVSQKAKLSFERNERILPRSSWENTLPGSTTTPISSKNITSGAAQGLLSDYLTMRKDSGEALSAGERAQIAADLAKKVSDENAQKPTYVLGDVKLAQDSSDTYRTYGNAVGGLFTATAKNYPDNEVAIMQQAFTTNDPADFAKLSPNAAAYRTLAVELAKIPAPRSLAPIHLRFMNDYAAIAQALADVGNTLGDAMRSMVGITSYNQHLTDALTAGKDLADFFTKNNIVFSPEEQGHPLTAKTPAGQ